MNPRPFEPTSPIGPDQRAAGGITEPATALEYFDEVASQIHGDEDKAIDEATMKVRPENEKGRIEPESASP